MSSSMPYTKMDRIVLAIFDSRWFNLMWRVVGSPPLAVRMPSRRLPDGRRGFRVLRLQVREDS